MKYTFCQFACLKDKKGSLDKAWKLTILKSKFTLNTKFYLIFSYLKFQYIHIQAYILKVDFLDVRNPQKIQIFRRKIVSERENYQFCNVLEKILLIDTLSLCSIELNKHTSWFILTFYFQMMHFLWLLIDLRTFVAKFCRRDLRTFSADFLRLKSGIRRLSYF